MPETLAKKSTEKTSILITFLQFTALLLLALSYLQQNNTLVLIADALVYVIVLTSSPTEDFITYCFFMPFSGLMPSGIFRLYICVFISIFKLMSSSGKMSSWCLLGILYMMSNFIILDFFIGGFSSLLTLMSFMCYIFVIADQHIPSQINCERLARMSIASSALLLLTMLQASPSLAFFVDSSNIYNKFGETTRDIGGAMGVSLYASVGVAVASVMAVYSRGIRKLIYCFSVAFFSYFALMALSRTFFIALAIAVVVLFLSNLRVDIRIKGAILWKLPVFFFFAVMIINFVLSSHNVLTMFDKLEKIMENISTHSGRFSIWESIFSFLLIHPLTLLFGGGTNSYMWTDASRDYSFNGFGAHNLYLDILMSFGIIGCFFLIRLIIQCIKDAQKNDLTRKAVVSNGVLRFPLAMYFGSQMAQGSFRDLETYIFPLMICIVTYGLMKKYGKS